MLSATQWIVSSVAAMACGVGRKTAGRGRLMTSHFSSHAAGRVFFSWADCVTQKIQRQEMRHEPFTHPATASIHSFRSASFLLFLPAGPNFWATLIRRINTSVFSCAHFLRTILIQAAEAKGQRHVDLFPGCQLRPSCAEFRLSGG